MFGEGLMRTPGNPVRSRAMARLRAGEATMETGSLCQPFRVILQRRTAPPNRQTGGRSGDRAAPSVLFAREWQTQGRAMPSLPHNGARKITNAPAAIIENPSAWFHVIGSFSHITENPAKTTSVITSCMVLSSAAE